MRACAPIAEEDIPLTAMAVLLLVDRRAVTLDDRISRFVPNCPPSWQAITVHHLLAHTSGLPEYSTAPDFQSLLAQPWSPDALVERFRHLPLDFAPGKQFHYTNSGYVLLGRLIEQVAEMSYGHFLRNHLFRPLGMMQTDYEDTWPLLPRRAYGYATVGVPADPVAMSAAYAAGGVYSTVEDLYRWDQAMEAGRLLSRESYTAMFTKHAPISPTTLYRGGYGYGWYITEDFHPRTARLIPVVYHGGFVFGYHTQVRRYCRAGGQAALIVLSNLEMAPVTAIVSDIQQLLFGGEAEA